MTGYELTRRAVKVQRLLAITPVDANVDRLAAYSKAERAIFAAVAKVTFPSDLTWAALCDAVVARRLRRAS